MAPPHKVAVLGGGPAALATLAALRDVAGPRVRLTLVAPETDADAVRAHARSARADLYLGRAAEVDAERRQVRLADGRRVGYDALVVAIGARARVAYARAKTYFGHASAGGAHVALDRLLADLHDGHARSLAFVVPPQVAWTLPLYELAIQAGIEARAAGLDVPMRLLTPERTPLELFGARGRALVDPLLDAGGVTFRGATTVTELPGGVLREGRVGARFIRERVVALPELDGPGLSGLPTTFDGFIPVDGHGAVRGMADVYAAGAATAYPLRQRDLAEQQAHVVAATLARRVGVDAPAEPWLPRVRATLDAGRGRTVVLERGPEVAADADAAAGRRPRASATPSPHPATDAPSAGG